MGCKMGAGGWDNFSMRAGASSSTDFVPESMFAIEVRLVATTAASPNQSFAKLLQIKAAGIDPYH